MQINKISEEWLVNQNFQLKPGLTIDGVFVKDLTAHVDGRGDVIELWSQSWPEFKDKTIVPTKHAYQSATDPGVVKCWHLHKVHTDQFTVTRGKLQVSLIDVRENSPTFGQANKIILGVQKPKFIKIPPGIIHGWKALGDKETIVVNFQSHPYDAGDEFKFAWDCVMPEIWEPLNG